MKRVFHVLLIIIGGLILFYYVLSQFGILMFYHNTTPSNEPNIKLNSKILATNLKNPEMGDFVCYLYADKFFGEHIRVHRLCGQENDIIALRNGILYVNEKKFDEKIDLAHTFKVSKEEYVILKKSKELIGDNLPGGYIIDTISISVRDDYARENNLFERKVVQADGFIDESIRNRFDQNWNKDNFGPIKVPKGKIFVLGDNRDSSEDSRHIGFIDESKIVGTIIYK